MEGLPLLPGYSLTDPSKCNFTVGHNLVWKNGYPIARKPEVGIGGQPLLLDGVLYSHSPDPVRYDPSLTYGRTKEYVPPIFQPHFLLYAGKCLTFRAFFKQSVEHSPEEDFRIRLVNIIYFLEDDTITVMEPKVENAGFQQGRIVKRARIPKLGSNALWHWKDLDIGVDMDIYGIVYHICDSDRYTRAWLESQGVELGRPEVMPVDPYTQKRGPIQSIPSKASTNVQEDKYTKFLKWDIKALRFNAVWDWKLEEKDVQRKVRLHYYLADDTMDIYDNEDDGEMSLFGSRAILKKTRVPKRTPSDEINDAAISFQHTDTYISPEDLIVGKTVLMMGRRFFIYDCDAFTRKYYRERFSIEQPKVELPQQQAKQPPARKIPPYSGMGSHADSMMSYYYLDPKSGQVADKMAFIRYLQRSNLRLRYTAEMDHVHPEDQNRQFVIEYRLCDGNMMIHELKQRNSGFMGGRFLKYSLVPKTGTNPDNPEYFTPHEFRLGAVIEVYGHRFRITGVDLAVYRYMEANPEKFTAEMVEEVRKHLLREGHLAEDIKEVGDYRKQEELTEPVMGVEPASLPAQEELPAEKQLPRTDFRIRKHKD